MRVGVLGPLQVDVEGVHVVLPSAGQRRLLSLLALHGGSVVPSAAIQDELHLAHGALRTSMSRLRRSIGETAIATEAPGYRLREVSIDAVRFEQLLELARSAADGTARVHLSAAVGLWRGAAYAEFAHEPWARAESVRLDDARASATEELADLFLCAGEPASALDLLDRLVDVHPYRDRPRALQLRLADGPMGVGTRTSTRGAGPVPVPAAPAEDEGDQEEKEDPRDGHHPPPVRQRTSRRPPPAPARPTASGRRVGSRRRGAAPRAVGHRLVAARARRRDPPRAPAWVSQGFGCRGLAAALTVSAPWRRER